jgi:hypothetical protein
MIDIVFAIILGYGLAATLGGFLSDGDLQDRILIRLLLILIALGMLSAFQAGNPGKMRSVVVSLSLGAVFEQTYWFLSGAAVAFALQVHAEGYLHDFWVRFHPQSAPTQDVGAGQRARVAGFAREAVPSTLVGTSTQYLAEDMDLRTETLVRLCFYAFDDVGAHSLSRIESHLRVGTGRKQRAFHKLVAGLGGRTHPKKLVHRYWRSVNGSTRMGMTLFGDLCDLAYNTGNLGGGTVPRLRKVGAALNLTRDDMSRALSRLN